MGRHAHHQPAECTRITNTHNRKMLNARCICQDRSKMARRVSHLFRLEAELAQHPWSSHLHFANQRALLICRGRGAHQPMTSGATGQREIHIKVSQVWGGYDPGEVPAEPTSASCAWRADGKGPGAAPCASERRRRLDTFATTVGGGVVGVWPPRTTTEGAQQVCVHAVRQEPRGCPQLGEMARGGCLSRGGNACISFIQRGKHTTHGIRQKVGANRNPKLELHIAINSGRHRC